MLGKGKHRQRAAQVPPPACPRVPTILYDPGVAFLIPGLTGWYVQRYKSCVRAGLSLEIYCHGRTALLLNSVA